MTPSSWRLATTRLNAALERDEADCGVAETVLAIAVGEYPRLDVGDYLGKLDGFAFEVRKALATTERVAAAAPLAERRGPASVAARQIAALNEVLFDRHGFVGDREDYYNPETSFHNRVLDRRRGIPITLGAIYLEVARRAGIPMSGVGFPGHFLVKHTGVVPALLIDPFSGGAILSETDCRGLLESMHGDEVPFHSRLLAEATRREIAVRVLRNLKAWYVRVEDFPRAFGVADCLVHTGPDEPAEWRDRGMVRLRLDDTRGALSDFLHYLDMVPPSDATVEVEEAVTSLRAMLARMN